MIYVQKLYAIISIFITQQMFVKIELNLKQHYTKTLIDLGIIMNIIFVDFTQWIKTKNCEIIKLHYFNIVTTCNII